MLCCMVPIITELNRHAMYHDLHVTEHLVTLLQARSITVCQQCMPCVSLHCDRMTVICALYGMLDTARHEL